MCKHENKSYLMQGAIFLDGEPYVSEYWLCRDCNSSVRLMRALPKVRAKRLKRLHEKALEINNTQPFSEGESHVNN